MSKEEKKARKEAKLARRAEKKARWEGLLSDLDHMKKENARLSSKLERLNGAVSNHINVNYPEMLASISTILNEEPKPEFDPEEDAGEVSDEEIEKIVEGWDFEELVRVFWAFVNDQGIESDFMDYARNVARNEL